VIMYYVSANRDERVFANPDRLDVRRANADKHIAFGKGPTSAMASAWRSCSWKKSIARSCRRFPDIRQSDAMEVEPNNFVYAIRSCPSRSPRRREGTGRLAAASS